MIEMIEVRKAFNQGRHNEFWALDGINLTIEAHRVTALCGPSGSGKTTLLTLIGCLARPTSGRARFKGEDISGLPERFLTQLRRRSFGFVFQQFNLIRGLSAEENVMLPAAPSGLPQREVRAKAAMLLDRLRLAHRRTARVEWLSGGEQQRVAIARALINDPEVLIADEPTANLDTTLAREFLAILESLASEGRTIILSSHDPLVIRSAAVHRVIDMRDGRIVNEPPPKTSLRSVLPPRGAKKHLGRPGVFLERNIAIPPAPTFHQ